MNRVMFGLAALAGMTVVAFDSAPANALGGPNSSYARAYCEFYRAKIGQAPRYHEDHDYDRSKKKRSKKRDRRSAEYWRRVYKDCLKEHGF